MTVQGVVYPGDCLSPSPAGARAASSPALHVPKAPDYVSERGAGRLHLGAGLNPRPLEPAATCPQAKALTPGAQVKCSRQLRAAPAPPPAPRKSPPSATGSDARPGAGGAGAGGGDPEAQRTPPNQADPVSARRRRRQAWIGAHLALSGPSHRRVSPAQPLGSRGTPT